MKSGLLKRIGIASALGLALTMKAPSLDFKCTGDLAWDFFSHSKASLLESARLVPIHPSDTYANPKNNGPVEDVLKSISFQNIKLRLGVELEQSGFQAGAGLGAGIALVSYKKEGFGMAKRNYTNAPGTDQRGYGAALTYIYLEEEGTIGSVLNPFVRLGYQIKGKEGDANLFAEYSPEFISFTTNLETGYDRWDRLQVREVKKLKTSVINHFFKVGVGFSPKDENANFGLTPEIYVGMSNPEFTGKEEPGIKFGESYIFGVTLKINSGNRFGK